MDNKGLLHTEVVRQHTVPRFLLENFAISTEKKKRTKQVYALNKESRNVLKMSVKDATVHSRFYNLQDQPSIVSLESLLSFCEGSGATVIRKLISTKNIRGLTEEERNVLARFVTVQLLRSRGEYENQKHIAQKLYHAIKSKGIISKEVENYFSDKNFEQNTKSNFLNRIADSNFEMSVILEKKWLLFETTKERPFYISDNPVTMFNDTDFTDRSNTGIALPGIQIYFPISATLVLAMVCPSLYENLKEERDLIFKFIANNMGGERLNVFERLTFLKDMLDKRVVNIEGWRLEHLNNLQVWRAEHFVFSSLDDFDRVKKLIGDCPELVGGPRSIVS